MLRMVCSPLKPYAHAVHNVVGVLEAAQSVANEQEGSLADESFQGKRCVVASHIVAVGNQVYATANAHSHMAHS